MPGGKRKRIDNPHAPVSSAGDAQVVTVAGIVADRIKALTAHLAHGTYAELIGRPERVERCFPTHDKSAY